MEIYDSSKQPTEEETNMWTKVFPISEPIPKLTLKEIKKRAEKKKEKDSIYAVGSDIYTEGEIY